MNKYFKLSVFVKGYCMGIADIIPGISGGTIALILGIYNHLLQSLSRFDTTLLKMIKNKQFKNAFEYIDLLFLINVFTGILTAIISMSHLVHYLMSNFPIYTWSFFFGLILSSVFYLLDKLESIKISSLIAVLLGCVVGYFVATLTPVDTPNSFIFIVATGFIAITAMILPGISGSFLLLILGKYAYITAAIKNLGSAQSIEIVIAFIIGAILSLLSFSKLLSFLLEKFPNFVMSVLIGFILGSVQKVWPWRSIENSIIIRGKEKILSESLYFPDQLNTEVILALTFMLIGFSLVITLLLFQKRGVSSAG